MGLRIDHVLLSPAAAGRLQAAGVDRSVRGEPNASDYCLYEAERPRAVIKSQRTDMRNSLPTKMEENSTINDKLVDQLEVLPEFVTACGFTNAKAPGYEDDDFLAAAVAAEERRHGTALVPPCLRDTSTAAEATRHGLAAVPARGGTRPSRHCWLS